MLRKHSWPDGAALVEIRCEASCGQHGAILRRQEKQSEKEK